MTRSRRPEAVVVETLRALGGHATLGDIVSITGLARAEVETALQELIAADQGHVRVSDSGVVIYHFGKGPPPPRPLRRPTGSVRELLNRFMEGLTGTSRFPDRRTVFDRKTLRLIRAREGVLSLAELVEHTGLPMSEAKEEMRRLAECYGGESHPSWDGHVVCAFPGLMTSADGRFPAREPRPAWVRAESPMRHADAGRRTIGPGLGSLGLISSIAAPWIAVSQTGAAGSPTVIGLVLAASAYGIFYFGRRLVRAVEDHPRSRFRSPTTLRRYALGYVFETALKGKGVVSLDRTVQYLQARAGQRKVKRAAVEKALRQLAEEFDAPMTEHNGDLFFGFRNVKRQFLASHVQRRRLKLAQIASGRTVFDTADSPQEAAARELESFDRDLDEGHAPPGLSFGAL